MWWSTEIECGVLAGFETHKSGLGRVSSPESWIFATVGDFELRTASVVDWSEQTDRTVAWDGVQQRSSTQPA